MPPEKRGFPLKTFHVSFLSRHTKRSSLVGYKKMFISPCILFWTHNSRFQFPSLLDWEPVQPPKARRESSELTAHIISRCLLSSSFHLASIAFVFLFFLASGCYPHKSTQPIMSRATFKQFCDLNRMVIYATIFNKQFDVLLFSVCVNFLHWSKEAALKQRQSDWDIPVCRILKSQWSSSFHRGSRYRTDNWTCNDNRQIWAMELCKHKHIIYSHLHAGCQMCWLCHIFKTYKSKTFFLRRKATIFLKSKICFEVCSVSFVLVKLDL